MKSGGYKYNQGKEYLTLPLKGEAIDLIHQVDPVLSSGPLLLTWINFNPSMYK